MAFTGNYMPTSFKVGILNGAFSFAAGTGGAYYIALFTDSASFTAATTQYVAPANGAANPTNTGEVTSTGTAYTTGGNLLTVSLAPNSSSGTTAYINFSDTTWTTATITARGAMIYRLGTYGGVVNPAIAILDFGSDKSSSASNFTIQFPAVGVNGATAILRIA
jgi:hypothetical protein